MSNTDIINKPVRTRFAPSPTGLPESIHLGFIIRALWCYAVAKKNLGQFILRMEDTDSVRSRSDTEDAIYATLNDFKIIPDESDRHGGEYGPYTQSKRLDIYKEYAHKLVDIGAAYFDFDAVKREKAEIKAQYDDEEAVALLKTKPVARYFDLEETKLRVKNGEPYVVRVKMPENKVISWNDWILRKEVKIHSKEVSDLIILKSDGFPTYHLAVVVDDYLMNISHVFRGFEWISTTPIHLFLFESLGITPPIIGHFPVILDPRTKKKFSKRDMSAMFGVKSWLELGYLKEAILNYLMLLGWAPKDNREIFSLEEFVECFDQNGIQKSNPIFDLKKIDWFQGIYMRSLNVDKLLEELIIWNVQYGFDKILTDIYENDSEKEKVYASLKLLQERTLTLKDLANELKIFFHSPIEYQNYTEVSGIKNLDKEMIINIIKDLYKSLEYKIQEDWVSYIRQLSEKYIVKHADIFMLLRLAVWGKQYSPPLFESIQILGESECTNRLNNYSKIISAQ